MDTFLHFILLQDALVTKVLIGIVLISISSSVTGVYTLLRKRALTGDALAHAVLPGVCLAFMIEGEKNPVGIFLGASFTGWLSIICLDFVSKNSRIKEDTITGIVLSVFFGLGIVLLTVIQHTPGISGQSGLDHFLFGDAIGMSYMDLGISGFVTSVILLSTTLFYKEFFLISFDENYSQVIGFPVKTIRLLMTTLTVMSVVIGIQSVGVVLMAAMLITPAAAARFWSDKFLTVLVLSVLIAILSGIIGVYISYVSPSPTGPFIVLTLSIIAIASFLFSPQKGIVSKLVRQKKFRNKIIKENILKAFYQLEEKNKNHSNYSIKEILYQRPMYKDQLMFGLNKLTKEEYLAEHENKYSLTKMGEEKGRRLVKLHRLWEVYLTQYANIAADHVHDDAETIEHIITPEIEKKLEEFLAYPDKDPHNSSIPYSSKNK